MDLNKVKNGCLPERRKCKLVKKTKITFNTLENEIIDLNSSILTLLDRQESIMNEFEEYNRIDFKRVMRQLAEINKRTMGIRIKQFQDFEEEKKIRSAR